MTGGLPQGPLFRRRVWTINEQRSLDVGSEESPGPTEAPLRAGAELPRLALQISETTAFGHGWLSGFFSVLLVFSEQAMAGDLIIVVIQATLIHADVH